MTHENKRSEYHSPLQKSLASTEKVEVNKAGGVSISEHLIGNAAGVSLVVVGGFLFLKYGWNCATASTGYLGSTYDYLVGRYDNYEQRCAASANDASKSDDV